MRTADTLRMGMDAPGKDAYYGVPAEVLADLTGVHVTTARRWKRGEPVPVPAARLLAILLTGDLGLIAAPWRGWRLVGGELLGPDVVHGATPGEVQAIPFVRAQVQAYQQRQRFACQADWVEGRYVGPDELSAPGPELDERQTRYEAGRGFRR